MEQHFRYATQGSWYKGNTHIHSIVSDGALDFPALASLYAGAGYDFLFRTDHWAPSDAAGDPLAYPLLWLDGIELDGKDSSGVYYHVACLGDAGDVVAGMGLEEALAAVRGKGGLAILAHPHWTGNGLQDALRHPFDGMEIYNHVCQWMNGKGHSGMLWDAMLETRPEVLLFASDDTHLNPSDPGWNGGWIMVNAAECTREAVFSAIRDGNYYASTGPAFKTIEMKRGRVRVETSPVKFIRLVGPRYYCQKNIAPQGETITSAEFEVPAEWASVYIQLEDAQNRLAWTNPLFV